MAGTDGESTSITMSDDGEARTDYNSDSEGSTFSSEWSFEYSINDGASTVYEYSQNEENVFHDAPGFSESEDDVMNEYESDEEYTTNATDNETDDQEDEMDQEVEEDSPDNSVMILDCTTFPVPLNDGSYEAPAQENPPDVAENDDEVIFVSEDKKEKPNPPRRSSICVNTLSCAICLESLKERNKPVSTSCGHLFCYRCLTTAIERSHKCPLCNARQGKNTFHRIFF